MPTKRIRDLQNAPQPLDLNAVIPLDTTGITGKISINDLMEVGGNANGAYVRLASGLQICWQDIRTTDVAPPVLSVTWTFPAPFIYVPVVHNSQKLISGAYVYAGSATPWLHFGLVTYTYVSNSSATLAQYHIAGAPDFQAGDYATFVPIAIGRWR